jgi:hypothetical protein
MERTEKLQEQFKIQTDINNLAQQQSGQNTSLPSDRRRTAPELSGLSVGANKSADEQFAERLKAGDTGPILSQILERVAPEILRTVGLRIKEASDELEPRLLAMDNTLIQATQKVKDQHENLLSVATEISKSIATIEHNVEASKVIVAEHTQELKAQQEVMTPLRQDVRNIYASVTAVGKNLEESKGIVAGHGKILDRHQNALSLVTYENNMAPSRNAQVQQRTGSSTASSPIQRVPPVQFGVEQQRTIRVASQPSGVVRSSQAPSPQTGASLIQGGQFHPAMIKEITTNQIVHRHAIDEIKQRLNNISTETLSNAISAQITARYPILDMKTVRNELDRLEKMAVAQKQAIALMSKEMTNLLEERIKPVLVSLDLLHGAFNGNQNSYGIAQKIGIVEKKLQEVLRKLPAAAPASKTPPEDFARSQIDAALQPCIANIKAEMKTSLSKFDIDFNGTETSEGLLQRLKRL